jgi:L-ascorbate metabolism protein UlaG (beta-lactamase superfamily)
LHRRKALVPPPSAYNNANIVLISHAHHDHLSKPTLRQFPDSTVVLCPEPCGEIIQKLGKRVAVMAPGESYPIPGGRITAVAAHHPGGRNSTNAEPDGRALGFVIETTDGTIYYSGDTDYFPGIAEVGSKYRPDLVLLNVNGHLPARDAFKAFRDLGSPRVIPIHAHGYGGPKAGMNLRQHAEFAELLGPMATPLSVGESYPLALLSAEFDDNR